MEFKLNLTELHSWDANGRHKNDENGQIVNKGNERLAMQQ
jgi:hypothetical protein